MTFAESYERLKARLRTGEYLNISSFLVSRQSVEESGEARRYGGTLFHKGLGQGFSLYGRKEADWRFGDSPVKKRAYLKLADFACTLRVLSNGRKYLILADRMKDAGLRFKFSVTADRWDNKSFSSRKIFAFSNLTRSEASTITRAYSCFG